MGKNDDVSICSSEIQYTIVFRIGILFNLSQINAYLGTQKLP